MKKRDNRDPRCVAAGCKLDGRNCDPSNCDIIKGKSAELLQKGDKVLCDDCGGYHG